MSARLAVHGSRLKRIAAAGFCVLMGACASLPDLPQAPLTHAVVPDATTPLGQIAGSALGTQGLSGFRVLPYGVPSFLTRLELARQAQHTLDVQYYLIARDNSGILMLRALRDAAVRGVRVRLLLDDLYTSGEDPMLSDLSAYPNIEIRLFNPFAGGRTALWSRFASEMAQEGRLDHRMHNKLFVADSEFAVMGGRNIADEYFMRAADNNYVDVDLLALGPVVPQLANGFDAFWNSDFSYPFASVVPSLAALNGTPSERQTRFDNLAKTAVVPTPDDDPIAASMFVTIPDELRAGHLDTVIHASAEAIVDSPAKASGSNMTNIEGTVTARVIELLNSARSDVVMVSPYFVPGEAGLASMRNGVQHGVKIMVITNSLASTDVPLAQMGYIHYRKAMLEAGIKIHELSPTRVKKRGRLGVFRGSFGALHAKFAVVDGRYTFMGSMNLDGRSAYENTELGVIIDSTELAEQLGTLRDRASAYDLRLSPQGQVQWVADEDGVEKVFDEEPESGFWRGVEIKLMSPVIPEKQL